jgi:hypothetical protein
MVGALLAVVEVGTFVAVHAGLLCVTIGDVGTLPAVVQCGVIVCDHVAPLLLLTTPGALLAVIQCGVTLCDHVALLVLLRYNGTIFCCAQSMNHCPSGIVPGLELPYGYGFVFML